MTRAAIRVAAAVSALAALAVASAPAQAAPAPIGYQENDVGGFRNILPPGQGQNVNVAEAAGFLGGGQQPPFTDDQLQMYEDLVYATPGLPDSQIDNFFKDASFGVRPADVTRTYTPMCILPTAPQSDACEKVTIQRDQYGVPHITGETRLGAMFGAGYASAEDRLFFMDALRHAGRGNLSAFAGGTNVGMDRDVWRSTPYNEEELQLQFDLGDDVYGADGAQLQADVVAYVDGINQYIAEIKSVSSSEMPVEYPALGQPQGPDPWKVTDVISTASLVAGIFGKGGGGEVGSALVLEEAKQQFGRKQGKRVWADFRSQNDPEADTTIHSQPFPYGIGPRKARKTRGLALPDEGTTQTEPLVVSQSGNAQSPGLGGLGDLLEPFETTDSASNALLVSGSESASGHPIAVFGPQVSYFTPQILMEQDVHAPATNEGPAIDARGTAFLGTNLYVQLGRGIDYSWSATSAGQDITDTFALPLCETDGSRPSIQSQNYFYRGACHPFEVLERENCWTPTFADGTPAGCETLRSLRTPLGIVSHRTVIGGEPYVYTKLRATYFHEVDSALGFADFNDPNKVNSPESFMQAACRIDYTFNWFYIDNQHIAYFNSGKQPVRAPKVDPNFPTMGTHEWQNFDPELNETAKLPCDQHPQIIDQQYLSSWNNKQAPKFSAADGNFGYGSVYRVEPLDERIQAGIAGSETMTPGELVSAMEDAGTVDLRGDSVLPLALKVIRKGGPVESAELRNAIDVLTAWSNSGAHRRDANADGVFDDAEAIRIMDAWWPGWVEAQFKPALGNQLFGQVQDQLPFDDANREHHMGSAFQDGWWGYVSKDLRTILSKKKKKGGHKGGKAAASKKGKKNKVRGRYSRVYCGGGKLRRCREALLVSLQAALAIPPSELYPAVEGCTEGDNQWCHDAIQFRPVGLIDQPYIHWINRPTFQQVVEIFQHR